jgi:hypothetical protein
VIKLTKNERELLAPVPKEFGPMPDEDQRAMW